MWIPAAAVVLSTAVEPGGVYLDVPFVRQSPQRCGAAALAMVMRYWGQDVDHATLALENSGPEGATAGDLMRAGAAHGFPTRAFSGTAEQLRTLVRSGRPVIAALTSSSGRGPNHFVVVVGATAKAWIVHDPARGPYQYVDVTEFARRWERVSRWALLLDRPPTAPSPRAVPQPSDDVRVRGAWAAASAYFREEQYEQAREALQEGLVHVPDDVYGNEFLAAVLHLEGRTVEALHHWNVVGAPVIRKVVFHVTDTRTAEQLSRVHRVNQGERLTRDAWIDSGWLDKRLFPNHTVRRRLVPHEDHDWALQLEVTEPMHGWKARAARVGGSAAFNRELQLNTSGSDGRTASFGLRWQAASRRAWATWQTLPSTEARDRFRVAVALRSEPWAASQTAASSVRSGEAVVSYDYFPRGRRALTTELALLRHTGRFFVVSGLEWDQTLGLHRSDRLRLQFGADLDAFVPTDAGAAAQRGQASVTIRWDLSPDASSSVAARVSAGFVRGPVPVDRQFLVGSGPDAQLLLRAHPPLPIRGKPGQVARRFAAANTEIQRRLWSLGLFELSGVVFFDRAHLEDLTYTDIGGGVRVRAAGLPLDLLWGRDLRGSTTRLCAVVSRSY